MRLPDHTHLDTLSSVRLCDSYGRVIISSQRPLTTHNTQRTQTFIPPAGFEPAIPTSDRHQTHALDWDRRVSKYNSRLFLSVEHQVTMCDLSKGSAGATPARMFLTVDCYHSEGTAF